MSSLGGRISNCLASVSVAPNLSMFQFNFDFTFKKSTPPAAFAPIGALMNPQKRHNAEYGSAHHTAMKLGWLFEQIIPNTPELLRVYGLRFHDILRQPGVNPIGSSADGPFEPLVGADTTAVWAAATSGIASLGVHLLACILARAWGEKQSVAIWIEIIRARQAEIFSDLENNNVVSETSLTAARREFLKEELQELDSSARSWLACADEAPLIIRKRTQFLLIAKNLNLQTGCNTAPYVNVKLAWITAMKTMERHLGGTSQEVSDGAVLYAISAWHLFPDFLVFGQGAPKYIKFDDDLFVRPAVMTLGKNEIANVGESSGPHWSLALSHLRCYGNAVPTDSVEDLSRVSIIQLHVVLLGYVLESWGVTLDDRMDAIRWLHTLWQHLKNTNRQIVYANSLSTSLYTSWIAGLSEAAERVQNAEAEDFDLYQDLLSHGERCVEDFLPNQTSVAPFFGLCNPSVMAALREDLDIEAGFTFLRHIAKDMGLEDSEVLLCYSEETASFLYHEYATAIPHLASNPTYHARWIKLRPKDFLSLKSSSSVQCVHPWHKFGQEQEAKVVDVCARRKMITEKGELVFDVEDDLYERAMATPRSLGGPGIKEVLLVWENPVALYSKKGSFHTHTSLPNTASCNCLHSLSRTIPENLSPEGDTTVLFRSMRNSGPKCGRFEMFVKIESQTSIPWSRNNLDSKHTYATGLTVSIHEGIEYLKMSPPSPVRTIEFIQSFACVPALSHLSLEEQVPTPLGLDWKVSRGRAVEMMNITGSVGRSDWLRSLEFMGMARRIYNDLPKATISLTVLDYPLSDAHWTKIHAKGIRGAQGVEDSRQLRGTQAMLENCGREEALACIAMLQTGSANIKPDDLKPVIAISTANSIFVPAFLLSDPCDEREPYHLRHIVGSVGLAGLSLMVGPEEDLIFHPQTREVQRLVKRSAYSLLKREDCFKDTSLHLSLTGYRHPLMLAHTMDQEIYYVESVVSLRENGKPIVDLDMLRVELRDFPRVLLNCHCMEPTDVPKNLDVRSLGTWQDILKPPRRIGVMKAHKNWAARLAAVAFFLQIDKAHTVAVLSPENLCWTCLSAAFNAPEDSMPEIFID